MVSWNLEVGQDRFTPDCDTVDGPAYCGVCKTELTIIRGHEGPRGFVQGLLRKTSKFDVFQCPHTGEDWHNQVRVLQLQAAKNPSQKIEKILCEEAEEILSSRQATKKVSRYFSV